MLSNNPFNIAHFGPAHSSRLDLISFTSFRRALPGRRFPVQMMNSHTEAANGTRSHI
jgi:hypothetical protein